MDKSWIPTVVFLVVAVGGVALFTRIAIWLIYCFKAAPHRSGSEEMELAERARDLQEGKSTYTSYEQWRKDILSDKPISEIVGRVPEGFFDKKPEPPVCAQGSQGALVTVNYKVSGSLGSQGSLGPQGPQGDIARQRLAEMKDRLAAEENQHVKARLAEVRQSMLGVGSIQVGAPYYPIGGIPKPYYQTPNVKPYCHHCKGTGYTTVLNMNGIPTSGVRCAWCNI